MIRKSQLNLPHRQLMVNLGLIFVLLFTGSCSIQLPSQPDDLGKIFPRMQATMTPFLPVTATAKPVIPNTPTAVPSPTPEPVKELSFWLDHSLPPELREKLSLPDGAVMAEDPATAEFNVGAVRGGQPFKSDWVYALVAPFPTLVDDISLGEIQATWRGDLSATFSGNPLFMSPATKAAFTAWWGPASDKGVKTIEPQDLLNTAWQNQPAWAIIPFEDLEPRWKVLRIDGLSPLDRDFNLQNYPLVVWFGVSGNPQALARLQTRLEPGVEFLPVNNRDPQKLTVLVMTGVTALVRATGAKMDALGPTYPASDIHAWLYNADILHISNEVSFNPDCPMANPNSTSMMFCSRPEYIELLDYIGTDIVELSGNHGNDWGRKAFSYSLELYQQRGWPVFAGGANLDEAARPAILNHNGNNLAFIGCNRVGPPGVFATVSEPGSMPCDMNWLTQSITELRAQGYLPVVTFQYNEYYIYGPSEEQQRDFRAAAEAGAVIVSGSQAHFPQTVDFYGGAFIHYGLGNLFFDQMDIPVKGTRQEFIDRHIFYEGKYMGVELLTAMLEDYARPRPMTIEERQSLLSEIFQAGEKWLK